MVIFAVGCKSGESQIWLMHDCAELAGLVHIEEGDMAFMPLPCGSFCLEGSLLFISTFLSIHETPNS